VLIKRAAGQTATTLHPVLETRARGQQYDKLTMTNDAADSTTLIRLKICEVRWPSDMFFSGGLTRFLFVVSGVLQGWRQEHVDLPDPRRRLSALPCRRHLQFPHHVLRRAVLVCLVHTASFFFLLLLSSSFF
jgi:hypothetical protein